jgi:hypothetical protein
MTSESMLQLWRKLCLAGSALLLALLACNVPAGVKSTAPPPTAVLTPTATQTVTVEPPATDTPLPPYTPEPVDPLVILDTYESLTTVRQRLEDMAVTRIDGVRLTGRQMLKWVLVDRQYDPTWDNARKERVFSDFDDYTFPHPGARIYLVNVATGLFAEAHGLYAWSLADYSPREIDNLFIEDSSLVYNPDPALHRGDLPQDMPNVRTHYYLTPDKIVEDAHYKQFNLARRLTWDATTQEEAAALLVVWMQQNFFHAYAPGYGWEVYLDGREPRTDSGPVAYPTSIERIYEERVSGCHEPTILLEGMLHSLSVPAVRLMVHGHGVLYLPTLDRYVHGDHVVAYTDAPPGMLLLTADEFCPFAEDEGWIYAVVYPDKYQSPFKSMPLWRDGNSLYIQVSNVREAPGGPCVEVSEEDWARVSQQLSAYNLRYDTEKCGLSSDKVPILTLDELNDLDS